MPQQEKLLKVIRFDRKSYSGGKTNPALEINNQLALAEEFSILGCIPRRKAYRKFVMQLCNNDNAPKPIYPVSGKDIKRLEYSIKCELPINAVDILEVLVTRITEKKNRFKYRAQDGDTDIISRHILKYTIQTLEDLSAWLDGHPRGLRPECDKFRDEVSYITKRFDEFNQRHPGIFNSLFADF